MKILITCPQQYPPRRKDVSVLFGRCLPELGHSVDWLLLSQADCRRSFTVEWGGGTAYVARTDNGPGFLNRLRKHTYRFFNDMRMYPLLRRVRYDLVIVKDKFLVGLLALAFCRRFRCRFVFWLSYPFPEHFMHVARTGVARYPRLSLLRGILAGRILYRVLLPRADHVFVQSEKMKRDVARANVPAEKITAVPMGVEEVDAKGETDDPEGEEENVVLYLGTLSSVRRLDFLVRVLGHVLEKVPDARLVLVGKEELPGEDQLIRREAARLGIADRVVFRGQLPFQDARALIRKAAVCVSPYHPSFLLDSTSPTKLIEYMSLGKAVVANDHPEQREVIAASGGGLCVPYDEEKFAEAVLQLLGDPPLRKEMGRRGLDYVEAHRLYPHIARKVERDLLLLTRDR